MRHLPLSIRSALSIALAFSILSVASPNQSFAAQKKAKPELHRKEAVKHAQRKKRKKKVVKIIDPIVAAPVLAPQPAADAAGGLDCPAPGHHGIFSAAEFASVITENMAQDIDICADLEFQPDQLPSIYGGVTGNAPFEYAAGFSGTLHGRGHTLRVAAAPTADQQGVMSLGFYLISGATIQDLTLEVPGAGVGAAMAAPPLIASYGQDSVLRNITFKNATASGAVIAEASRMRFENITGDIKLRPGRDQRVLGGLVNNCKTCDFHGIDLAVSMDPRNLVLGPPNMTTNRPTYVGGLVGYSIEGSVRATDAVLSGTLSHGYDRGMIVGGMDGGQDRNPDGSIAGPAEFLADNVRVVNADLSQPASVLSYTVGALGGRVSAPGTIRRSAVRNVAISSSQQAGGLLGTGSRQTISEVALDNVSVTARNSAAGMIGYTSGSLAISDSYFNGAVTQSESVGPSPIGGGFKAAGGLLPYDIQNTTLTRVYQSGPVNADADAAKGALVAIAPDYMESINIVANSAYFDSSLASQELLGTGLSSQQMRSPASFPDFSSDVWLLRDGRLPMLKNRPLYTLQDLFDFIAYYFIGDARADLNDDSQVGIIDLFIFLTRYFGG